MAPHTVNFETASNILPCIVLVLLATYNAKCTFIVNGISYTLFKRGHWFLVPEKHIIKKFEEAIASDDPRDLPNLEVLCSFPSVLCHGNLLGRTFYYLPRFHLVVSSTTSSLIQTCRVKIIPFHPLPHPKKISFVISIPSVH
jgi:hypothetical protein